MKSLILQRVDRMEGGSQEEEVSWSLSLRLVRQKSLVRPAGIACLERPSFLDLLAVLFRINFWRMVGLYISFGDLANALECWRSPSLRLVIPGIVVPLGVTHSDSRHLWHDTVVKESITYIRTGSAAYFNKFWIFGFLLLLFIYFIDEQFITTVENWKRLTQQDLEDRERLYYRHIYLQRRREESNFGR